MTETLPKSSNPLPLRERMKIPRQQMREQPAQQRVLNFHEVNLGYSAELAQQEARRCLECQKPTCMTSCPVGVKVREFVRLIVADDFAGAAAVIREDNVLPAVTGRVCPQEDHCEAGCVLHKKGLSLGIGYLERFVADYEMKNGVSAPVEVPDEFHPEKVAIIGAGPAGLSCAYFLAKAGYHSVVFEALPEPGGMFRYGIPEYRLPTPTLMHEINWILSHGAELRCNTRIGKDISFDEIVAQFDAVFIGVGAHKGMKLRIQGEDLEGVVDGVDFLREVNGGKKWPAKGRVIVVGG